MPKSQNGKNEVSYIEAAYKVLEQEKGALHIREISDKAIKQGLIKSSGKTPQHTIGSYIYTDIKEKGEKSDFVKIRKATFALRKYSLDEQQQLVSDEKEILEENKEGFLKCAENILKKSGAKMHYKEITDKAIDEGILKSKDGKTPEATMRGAISTDIKKRHFRGEEPLFERLGGGFFGLAVWNDDSDDSKLNEQLAEHQLEIRKKLKEYLMSINPYDFEEFVGKELLESMGFKDIVITERSGDGGVDILAKLNIRESVLREGIEIKFAVQVKRWKNNVRLEDVRALRGATGDEAKYEKMQKILITTSDFDSGARKEAKLDSIRPISLINGEEIIDIMLEKRIGVSCIEVEIFEIKEEYSYFNNAEDNE